MSNFLRAVLQIGRFFLIAGIVCFLLASASAWRTARLVSAGTRIQGTVVRFERDREASFPIVTFQTLDGRSHEIRAREGTAFGVRPKLAVGDAMPVIYLPAQPEISSVDNLFHLWTESISPLVISNICLVLGVSLSSTVAWVQRIRRRRGQSDNLPIL